MINSPPPRPGPAQQQQFPQPNSPQQASPGVRSQSPAASQGQTHSTEPPPVLHYNSQIIFALHAMPVRLLDKVKFLGAYEFFRQHRVMTLTDEELNIDGKSIDMYALHCAVMEYGGYQTINSLDIWAAIAARIGFTNVSSVPGEPARSSPTVASKVAEVYKTELFQFDFFYLNTVLDSRRKMQKENALRERELAFSMANLSMNGLPPPAEELLSNQAPHSAPLAQQQRSQKWIRDCTGRLVRR